MEDMAARRARRAVYVSVLLLVLAFLVILVSMNTGTIRLSMAAIFRTLAGYGSADEKLIMFDYRLPRIIITILSGIGLGVAGAVMQGVSRNSLADPGIIGINAGAALGLIVFVSFFRTLEGPGVLMIPLFTFVGGMGIAFIIFILSYDRYRGLLPIRLILTGIAVAAGCSAVTLLLSLRLDEATYTFAARWLAGNVWGRDWVHVWTLLPWIVLLVPFIYSRSTVLDLFSLGDNIASGLGSQVTRNRLLMLSSAVALSCVSVSMAGGIGFIGLVSPHIARHLVGPRHRHFLPVTAIVGLVILVTADTVGRSIFHPNAIPAGVVVAAIGGPYFIYLQFRSRAHD